MGQRCGNYAYVRAGCEEWGLSNLHTLKNKFCILCNIHAKINLIVIIPTLLCYNPLFYPNNIRTMSPNLLFSTTGGIFFFTFSLLSAQTPAESCSSPSADADTSGEPAKRPFWLWRNAQVTGGQLTLPFKIRRTPEHNTFRLTTDVTLGGYVGYTRRLSEKRDFYLTVPVTAGLTFININDNNTTLDRSASDSEVIPGLSWSTGIVVQLEKYNFGLMIGKDYASEVGNQWAYHGKLWWSFGIGFVFLQ